MPEAVFEWHGREYEHNPKSADWYWAIGIIAAALAIATFLFGNYMLTVLIVIAATALALHAAKHPPVHRFMLTERGLMIDNDLHLYEYINSFSMLEYIDAGRPPVLSIKTDHWFSPHLLIPLKNVDADAMYAYLLTKIDEGEHKHSLTDLVAAWLGF
jgi:hypothetical protein